MHRTDWRKFDFKRDPNLQKSHQRHGNEVGIEMQKSYQTTITFERPQRDRVQGVRWSCQCEKRENTPKNIQNSFVKLCHSSRQNCVKPGTEKRLWYKRGEISETVF